MRKAFAGLWCSTLACSGEVPRGDTPAQVAQAAVAASPNWTRIEWQPFADTSGGRPTDYGIGVVAIQSGIDTAPRTYPIADTLVFRETPSADAAPVAAFVVEYPEQMNWRVVVLAPAGTRPNLLEFAYEESGVPIDSTDATGNWVRGLVGTDSARTMIRGWTDVRAQRVVQLLWTEHLPQHRWHFLDGAAALYETRADAEAARNGTPVPARPYTMNAIEVNGAFARVRMQWPFEECNEPDSAKRNDREFWIRYLDPRGRPLVFYASRGC